MTMNKINSDAMDIVEEIMEHYNNISKPKHYQGKYGIETLDVVKNFIWDLAGERAYYWGNIIKYLLRFQQKNGVEDLRKARQHLDWLIELEGENGNH